MKSSKKTLLILYVFLVLPSSQVLAWPWGPQTFDECVLEEMKGRTKDQRSIVNSVCLNRFPKIPSFLEVNHEGKLKCIEKNLSIPTTLEIKNDKARFGNRDFTITYRTKESIRGNVVGGPDANSGSIHAEKIDFELDFLSGGGALKITIDGSSEYFFFNCHE